MMRRSVRISRAVQAEIGRINGSRVVVAAVKSMTVEDAKALEHLGLTVKNGTIATREPAPPPRTNGLYARRNLDGWPERRMDLPKELRDISQLAPSWRNSGFHLVSRSVEAYPVEHHPAKLLTISAKVLEPLVDAALVRFRIDEPLQRDAPEFASNLAFNLRLLREAVGQANVFDADLDDREFARIQHVDWELLPPGSVNLILDRLSARKHVNADRLRVAAERLRALERLGHGGLILGTGRFVRYFGAKFGDRLVALENLEYGQCTVRLRGRLGASDAAQPQRTHQAAGSDRTSCAARAGMAISAAEANSETIIERGECPLSTQS